MPIRISKVYTRAGDKGKTRLGNGSEVSKSNLKLEVMGTLDELNSWVGLGRTQAMSVKNKEKFYAILPILAKIQNEIFDVGSELYGVEKSEKESGQLSEKSVQLLEEKMDQFQKEEGGLPTLSSFVLPGGSLENATFHLCRTVCRRAERLMVKLSEEESVNPICLRYINRLSDFFFVLSRVAAKKSKAEEFLWENGLSK